MSALRLGNDEKVGMEWNGTILLKLDSMVAS